MDPRSDIACLPNRTPCPNMVPLLAAPSLDDLLPDQREVLERHLPTCEGCQNARREYEVLHAMFDLVAREAPTELTDLLSRSVLSQLHAQITASPPPGVPPALQRLWAEEDQRRPLAARGNMLTGSSIAPSGPAYAAHGATNAPGPAAVDTERQAAGSSDRGESFLDSSLLRPDTAAEHAEASYSSEVAAQLIRAYTYLKQHRTIEAITLMKPVQRIPMSARQLMRVWYVMAHALAASSAYDSALPYLDEALAQACLLDDLGALAALAYLRGSVHGAILEFGLAADDLRMALESLRTRSSEAGSADPDMELEILVQLSSFAFVTACYDETAQYISQARRLIRLTSGHALEAAAIEWVEALLYRWSGQPELALRNALQAAACYLQPQLAATPLRRARIFTVVADCALDLAESLPQQPHFARDSLIGLARPYAVFAVKTARDAENAQNAENKAVHGLTLLTRTRYERLAHRAHERTSTIEYVVRTATHIGDKSLLAQAYTALGHEFAAHGDAEPALNCYRQALDVQSAGDAVALAVWARRGLLRAAEMAV